MSEIKYNTSIETVAGIVPATLFVDDDFIRLDMPSNLTVEGLISAAAWLARVSDEVLTRQKQRDREDLTRLRKLEKEEVEKRLIREEKAIFSSDEHLGR